MNEDLVGQSIREASRAIWLCAGTYSTCPQPYGSRAGLDSARPVRRGCMRASRPTRIEAGLVRSAARAASLHKPGQARPALPGKHAKRFVQPRNRLPPHLGYRQLQSPMRLLHAARGLALPAPRRAADAGRNRAGGARRRQRRLSQVSPDRRRADAARRPARNRRAARGGARTRRPRAHHQRAAAAQARDAAQGGRA